MPSSESDDEGFGPQQLIEIEDVDNGVPTNLESKLSSSHLHGVETSSEDTRTSINRDQTSDSFEFPLAFGKTKKKRQAKCRSVTEVASNDDESVRLTLQNMIEPSKAPKMSTKTTIKTQTTTWENLNWNRKEDNDDDEGARILQPPPFLVPQQRSLTLPAHERSVTALAINPKGSRLASGGYDAEVRLWDFNGMVSNSEAFRRFTPITGHGIRGLSYSPTGSHFICASGDAIGRVFDVDGRQVQMTVKGDMYVRDLSNTKGHTHGLTGCDWHPFDKEKFLTSSQDATVRVFDVNSKPWGIDQALPHLYLLKAVDKRNLNIAGQCHVTCARWAPCSAKYIVAGCGDGSLQLWNEKKMYNKPDKIIRVAHTEEVTGLSVFSDDFRIVSRSRDSTMKLWDLRKFKDPLHVFKELDNDISGLDVCISPDQTMIATGTTGITGTAIIHVFNATTFDSVNMVMVKTQKEHAEKDTRERIFGISSLLWPEALNQLILGCTDGSVRLYYDDQYSLKGALLFAGRQTVKRCYEEDLTHFNQPIFTMDTLPLGIKETREGGIRRARIREQDKPIERQQKTKVPPIPTGKEGTGGQRATHGSLSSYIMGKINISSTRDEDPVEALRAYAAKTEAEPVFVSKAYEETQPKLILDYTPEEGDDELLVQGVSKCPRCGLKMCQCGYMRLQEAIKGPVPKQRRVE